jgi:hypothetical protein
VLYYFTKYPAWTDISKGYVTNDDKKSKQQTNSSIRLKSNGNLCEYNVEIIVNYTAVI